MPSADAEIYFITAMMVLILVISFAAVYFFVRVYRKEMKAKSDAAELKRTERAQAEGKRAEIGQD